MAYVQGRSDLGDGWYARVEANYLSSFLFRQSFTQSYDEVISAEVHSTGFVEKDWSSYGLSVVLQRNENFQSITPGDTVIIRKLPRWTSRAATTASGASSRCGLAGIRAPGCCTAPN